MTQQTLDRTAVIIFAGLVAVLTISFTGKPVVNFLDSLVKMSAASDAETDKASPHESADLAAQRSMAFAAWLMLGTALLQIAIGVASVYFLIKTLVETQRSVRAAEDSVKTMRDLSNQETRPWLSIVGIHVEVVDHVFRPGGNYYRLICRVENHGHTPAIELKLRVYALPDDFDTFDSGIDRATKKNFPACSLGIAQETVFPSAEGSVGTLILLEPKQDNEVYDKPFTRVLVICVYYMSSKFEGEKVSRTCTKMTTGVGEIGTKIQLQAQYRSFAE